MSFSTHYSVFSFAELDDYCFAQLVLDVFNIRSSWLLHLKIFQMRTGILIKVLVSLLVDQSVHLSVHLSITNELKLQKWAIELPVQ